MKEDGEPEKLRCRTIVKEMRKILHMMVSAGVARKILLLYPA